MNQLVLLKLCCEFQALLAGAKSPHQSLTLRFIKTGQKCGLLLWRPYCFISKCMKWAVHMGKHKIVVLNIRSTGFIVGILREGKLHG